MFSLRNFYEENEDPLEYKILSVRWKIDGTMLRVVTQ